MENPVHELYVKKLHELIQTKQVELLLPGPEKKEETKHGANVAISPDKSKGRESESLLLIENDNVKEQSKTDAVKNIIEETKDIVAADKKGEVQEKIGGEQILPVLLEVQRSEAKQDDVIKVEVTKQSEAKEEAKSESEEAKSKSEEEPKPKIEAPKVEAPKVEVAKAEEQASSNPPSKKDQTSDSFKIMDDQ